ncbi:uncharacterized protein GGS22DRAFT_168433 [Annulohypoxylon maeteangense]|uniref:uncharacterized protein n=1 Tax=Annulohypoxylon maeteangense TaxID=1927788 RepID=UPI00200802E3|nr:uncharacterized protein GGS22DRAFT_168433 [Annulohypoxylon maeteangense]KAI0883329.1 hypothetical protein GGS22DRAFT_168433 [Annulohypoxylon maeteangense]
MSAYIKGQMDNLNNCMVHDGTQAWTMVSIYIDGVIRKNRVICLLRQLENDIDSWLSPNQKPERLAFYLEDNSSRAYSAKSYRIRGRLSPGDLSQMGVVSVGEDGDTARPATPRSEMEDMTRREVEEIRL